MIRTQRQDGSVRYALSPEDEEELQLALRGRLPEAVRKAIDVVLDFGSGYQTAESTAKALNVPDYIVRARMRTYSTGGLDALRALRPRGRPPSITEAQRAEIRRAIGQRLAESPEFEKRKFAQQIGASYRPLLRVWTEELDQWIDQLPLKERQEALKRRYGGDDEPL